MLTLGIDLASQPAETSACMLRWQAGGCTCVHLECGLDDSALDALVSEADVTGIDAPFGWPLEFLEFARRQLEPSTDPPEAWTPSRSRRLRLRATDRFVDDLRKEGRLALRNAPLSVSADKLAVPAMRCAGLLLRSVDPLGLEACRLLEGPLYEVYPAASLAHWLGARPSYKGKRRAAQLGEIVRALLNEIPGLDLEAVAVSNDHLLDGLLASLTARACALKACRPIPGSERDAARIEGWIAMPDGSLESLLDSGSSKPQAPRS